LSHRAWSWVTVVVAAGVAAAEWLRHPTWTWVAVAAVLLAALLVVGRRWTGWGRVVPVATLAGLVAALATSQARLAAIEHQWPKQRQLRIDAASERLAGDLHAALRRADRLTVAAASASATNDRESAFAMLERLMPASGPEMSLVILDADGLPWAWAGRHRLSPAAGGDSITARTTGYYVELEARRHTPEGRTAVAGVLIWAHPAVPDRGRSLAELFRERTEVGLTVYPPNTAPDSADVFDYEEPTTAGPRLLFSVRPVPPEQGTAKELAYGRGVRLVTWLVLLTIGLSLAVTARPLERLALLTALVWLAVRAPVGSALGLQPLFSPATFFRPVLGPLSGSAGVLALAGLLLTVGGVWLWRQRLPRRWYGIALGAGLLLFSPYVISALGRGITPPADGVPIGLWLSWHLALMVCASALIVPTAALFRGTADTRGWGHTAIGVAIALAAAVIGVLVWSPRGGWPDWYTFLWTPALLLVTLPAPRWAAIIGIALVAGSSSALVTWGAELAGRVQVAQRDVARLGDEPDPLAVPLLERFGEEVRRAPAPETASAMYALWHGSALGSQGYPSHLGLWTARGTLVDELVLDSLDLSPSLLATMVRGLPASDSLEVTPVLRVPGVHYVLVVRVGVDEVMTAAVGPRSELVLRGRVGRLLDPGSQQAPLYRLTLSPPADPTAATPRPRWKRAGWSVRNEYPLELPGGRRVVHASIDLRGPVPLFVRGVLVVLLDAAVLALLWLVAELIAGVRLRPPRWRSLARSFRIRLAVTLGAFFLLPAIGFAAWSFARLAEEVERSRDLLITQTLRDAVLSAGGLVRGGSPPPDDRLRELSRRIDADLALYVGGRLSGTSTQVLEDLGVMPQLMDPDAYDALAIDGELEVTRDGSIPALAERIGYRVVQPGDPTDIAVLATPQLADDSTLAGRQLDLGLVLLLSTLAGIAAALLGAQRASRSLSRPVAELRRSALALGRGQPMPGHAEHPPLEFEPVFGAFERMAADIRTSQQALEAARRRTAAVLGTVATGVVGIDPEGRVLIANRQAVDLTGVELEEGAPLLDRLGPEWAPFTGAVERYLFDPTAETASELEAGGRRIAFQLASLGPEVQGVVIALNDVTDVSRAERVLAWGEMARQVAHEIKNPLTPMRLGLQHLRRVYRDRRQDFDHTLEDTADRMLAEIDRLDTIARAFSRFAAPADDDAAPVARIDLAVVVGEVVQLYRLAEEGCAVRLTVQPASTGAARPDELKEVVVNLLENARNAGARVVDVTVGPGRLEVLDDGTGIPSDLLPRIFEPRFSTTTSGSGLGLAIVRRLVEGWGGRIDVESEVGSGTRIVVHLSA
jgi:two-component system, NtrC family, nitrogen regulation sensor histidine kinase NtrY